MADFNVLFTIESAWPEGHPNPQGFGGINWEKSGVMPFVPVAGMMINCGDGELRKVEGVYWSADKPICIEVNFEDDDFSLPTSSWLSMGWESDALSIEVEEIAK